MNLDTITLQNFRNFGQKTINAEKTNIIYGKNASGKTNIIEGIFTLTNGHSFKKSNTAIQKYNTERTVLKGKADNENIEIVIDKKKGKSIKLNDKKTTIMQLKEKFPSVIYSMDSFLSFKNKEYLFSLIDRNSFIEEKNIAGYLIEYKRAMKIKKGIFAKSQMPDENMLRIINDKIGKIMNEIIEHRKKSVEYINNRINETLKKFTKKEVVIEYKPVNTPENITKLEMYKKRVLTSLNRDLAEILLDGKNIFIYGSVGEKKIVLFSLIITIVRHYNKYTTPVILIDDIEGDLDKDSKNMVFDILTSLPNQLFLTTLGEYLYNDANIIGL